jgi:hypothetical protein
MFEYELDCICYYDPVHSECVEATRCEKLKNPGIYPTIFCGQENRILEILEVHG